MSATSINKRVLEFISQQDPLVGVTNLQVLAAVGRYISVTRAGSYGRNTKKWYARKNKSGVSRSHSLDELAAFGRRLAINQALDYLLKKGKIRRIRKGLYGPLLPTMSDIPTAPESLPEPLSDIQF